MDCRPKGCFGKTPLRFVPAVARVVFEHEGHFELRSHAHYCWRRCRHRSRGARPKRAFRVAVMGEYASRAKHRRTQRRNRGAIIIQVFISIILANGRVNCTCTKTGDDQETRLGAAKHRFALINRHRATNMPSSCQWPRARGAPSWPSQRLYFCLG